MNKQSCQTFQIVDVLGKKWTIPLLQEIEREGNRGFNHLLKRMRKITPKVFTQRLKQLEGQELILKRKVLQGEKRMVEYTLTDKGKSLQEVLLSLKQWCSKYESPSIPCGSNECVECEKY